MKVVIERLLVFALFNFAGQGDALRSDLLSRYYGKLPGHTTKPANVSKSLSHVTASSSASSAERGLVILSRAQMTLHDVQVTCLLMLCCLWC